MSRRIVKLAACAPLLLLGFGAAAQQEQESEPATANGPSSRVTVIKLDYADAEEVAYTLSQVLPPTIKIVAYAPTNSLIIVADPVIVADIARDRRE